MTLIMLIFWAALILGGIAVSRAVGRDQRPDSRGRAEQRLDEGFARGGIEEEGYIRRRELLRSGH